MAGKTRKRKTSPLEDLVELLALLPWWAGVMLAPLAYWGMHALASRPAVTVVKATQVGDALLATVLHSLASFGQYLLPLICLAAAALSAWRRRQRQALALQTAGQPAADALDGMSWQQFEQLVGEAFRQQGYAVTETGGGGADGGVDLVLRRGSEKFLVQCKQWRAYKVGVDVVRELYGVMAARGAAGGFVVTSGRFTEDAARFAAGRNLTLIDGPQLHAMLRQALARPMAPGANASPSSASSPAQLSCPLCGQAMLQRKARRGPLAGQTFWGCSTYPACRGTRPPG